MRISLCKTALVLALCFFSIPLFASDSPGPADPDVPADLASPAGPEKGDPPVLSSDAETGADVEADAEAATDVEADVVTDADVDAGADTETDVVTDADVEAAGGDAAALPPEDIDLEMTVYYDERTGADYVEIRTPEKIEEYHYLSHIRYSDLIFVLSDLLRRITRDGYRWASAPEISYEKNEEVALLYRKDLVNDMVYGVVQFPDFKVFLSGRREPDGEHRFNAENGRDMMTLVFSFASCLAQAEQTLGIKQLEYTMQFFKPE